MRLNWKNILIIIIFLAACREDDNSDIIAKPKPSDTTTFGDPTPFNLVLPTHFILIPPPFIPDSNPLTVEGIELGKKLFFERKLSKNNSVSCASCHHPEQSFNDFGLAFSPGFNGQPSRKNAMPLFNLAFNSLGSHPNTFNWDGVAASLEKQALLPVKDPIEMGEDWRNVAIKLSQDPQYPMMFGRAFGSIDIDSTKIIKALAQFQRTLISGESRADNELKSQLNLPYTGQRLTAQELRGYQIYIDEFKGDCSHCHGLGLGGAQANPLWTDFGYRNNGLDANPDSGLAAATKNPSDIGKFKTPSLRNLVFTAPYMHDGRFNTLEQVVDFYIDSIQASSPNIDGFMLKPRVLNAQERTDLVAFLKSITDSSFVNNPAFRP
jgi:cytochrome c peroxidase